jgi:hypothetical protein
VRLRRGQCCVEVTEVDLQVLSSGIFYGQAKAVIVCRLCSLNSGYLTSMCVQNAKGISETSLYMDLQEGKLSLTSAVLGCYTAENGI